MPDTLTIRGLEVMCHIGVPDEERARPQMLKLTLTFPAIGVAAAAGADDLTQTVNYFEVAEFMMRVAGEKPRKLIETLAEDICSAVLREFGVAQVELEVHKFIIPGTEAVVLRVRRNRA